MPVEEKIFQNRLAEVLKKFREKTAIAYGTRKMSYGELDEVSDSAARYLVARGIKRETFIGIMAADRIAFISAIIAVLKAGCVFVPLDPANPAERLVQMVDTVDLKMIIADRQCLAEYSTLPGFKQKEIEWLPYEEISSGSRELAVVDSPAVRYSPEDKIYIYFSSGTTGVPKAILGKNKSLFHYITWEVDTFNIGEDFRISQLAAPGFDAFIKEVFVALFSGAALCIPGNNEIILNNKDLICWINESGINLLHCVPSLFRFINTAPLIPADFTGLKYILLAGEVIYPQDLVNWYRVFAERIQLVNLYGLTETTILKTYYLIRKSDLARKRIPIGKPIKGSRVIILDKNMEVCNAGIQGEIYIRTPYRTYGYYNAPELNNKLLVPNPFNNDPNDLVCRTGDLGRFLEDGNIEFIGRSDRQVKIRGIRVELEEIEHLLKTAPGVKEAVVLKREISNNEFLTAYITLSTDGLSDEDGAIWGIKEYLLAKLPDNLVPAQVIKLDKIPKGVGGKVKYDELPDPLLDIRKKSTPPRSREEKKLADIWSEVLGITGLGVDDSFFELGGNSLNVMTLLSKIYREFNVKISFGELFNNPTIKKQADIIIRAAPGSYTSIKPVEKREYYDVSHSQIRIWVLNQFEDAAISFNRPHAFYIKGRFDKEVISEILDKLKARHESLRTIFITVNNQPKQKIVTAFSSPANNSSKLSALKGEYPGHGSLLQYIDLRRLAAEEKELHTAEIVDSEVDEPFNLSTGPLLRVKLLQLGEDEYIFLLSMHHIISDIRSMEVFFGEFLLLYDLYMKERKPELPPLKIQYRDFSNWQSRRLKGEAMIEHRDYWLDRLAGQLPKLELLTDMERPGMVSYNGGSFHFVLDMEVTRAINDVSKTNDVTLFMFFLAVLNILFYKLSYGGRDDIIIGTPVSAREHEDLSGQIGFFINTLALRTSFDPQDTFLTLLDKVKEVCLSAFEHQAFPFDELVDILDIDRDISRHPVFDVVIDMIDLKFSDALIANSAIAVEPFEAKYNKTKFDLTTYVIERKDTIEIFFEYNVDLFKKRTIAYYADQFRDVIDRVLKEPASSIRELSMEKELKLPPVRRQPKREDTGKAPASYHQERLWFIDQFESGKLYDSSPVYHNIPLVLEICGSLDTGLLEKSIRSVIKRHEILRTKIVTIDNKPVQLIEDDPGFKLQFLETSGDPISRAVEESQQPFLIGSEPLFRAILIPVESSKFFLVIVLHHLIVDRCSLEILAREIFLHYDAYINNEEPRLPQITVSYNDFARWQFDMLADLYYALLFHWKRKLYNHYQPLELPTDHPRAPVHIFKSARTNFILPGKLSEKIRKFSKKSGYSYLLLLMAAFKLLLFRYSGQYEIIIGTFGQNRNQPGTSGIIGPVANLLPLLTFIKDEDNFYEILSRLHKTASEAYSHQHIPFDRLVLELNPHKDMSRTALFDVLFQYEEKPLPVLSANNPGIRIIETNLGLGKYDLNMLIQHYENGGFSGVLVYNAEYYDETTISRFVDHYRVLMGSVLDNPCQEAAAVSFLTTEEKQQLVTGWNDTRTGYAADKTIREIFEIQALKNPHRLAVIFADRALSYRELDNRASRFASILRERYRVAAGELIGIMLERSENIAIGVLAILQSGGAYIPIDPNYPGKRINYILQDSACRYLLTHSPSGDKQGIIFPGIKIDMASFVRQNEIENKINLAVTNCPEDPAYVIYTSGTTGHPKGCMVSQKNLVRLLQNDKFPFDFHQEDTWIMAHSFCFDFSVWEMYGALLYGAKLVIPGWECVRDIGKFLSTVKRHRVTVLNQTPEAFYHFIAEEEKAQHRRLDQHLRFVIFGGDKLEPGYLKQWLDMYPLTRVALVNMYGITETTVHVSHYSLKKEDIELFHYLSPIGVPLPETTVYILDKNFNLQPVGVPGEFYVGGSGVCRGYLNKSELSCRQFIENPYEEGGRIYRTGDLGKRREDGRLEYLGRIDQQVKIRGYRIELKEIESGLLIFPGIKGAVVQAREDKEKKKYLAAYFAAREEINIKQLRTFLKELLPEYMVPGYFMQLKKFPLTANGKIDRKALPDPSGFLDTGIEFEAPGNDVEKKLAHIWQEVLSVGRVGINDNFFESGGHSLKASIFLSRLRQELNVDVPLKEIFVRPTIKELSIYISGLKPVVDVYSRIEQVEKKEYYPLSSAQKRLYVIHQVDRESIAYNMPAGYSLEGEPDDKNFVQVFNKLIDRHESLRTSFAVTTGQPVQKIHDQKAVAFAAEYFQPEKSSPTAEDVTLNIETIKNSFIRPFDLSEGPLLRVALVKISENKHILLVDIHHIISDGISMAVLIKDFKSLYQGDVLPPLRIAYKDFSEWQKSGREKKDIENQEAFWLSQFADGVPEVNLFTDYPRPAVRNYAGNTITYEIDEVTTKLLKELAFAEDVTLFILLLAIFNIFLARISSREDIVIGTPVAGRRNADLQDLVGVFVNTILLRNFIAGERPFSEFLTNVKQRALQAFENQEYPFENLVDKLAGKREKNRNPLFDVGFGIENTDIQAEEKAAEITGLRIAPYDLESKTAKVDLTLNCVEKEEKLSCHFQYDSTLFEDQTVKRYTAYFAEVIAAVLQDKNIKLSDIKISHKLLDNRPIYPAIEFEFNN